MVTHNLIFYGLVLGERVEGMTNRKEKLKILKLVCATLCDVHYFLSCGIPNWHKKEKR
jgi:hypothetical protein